MTALRSVVDAPPPSDIEMTFAPCATRYVMQFATPAVEPWPSGPKRALQCARRASNATPATPMPLLAIAAIVPDTWLPWSLSSVQPLAVDTVELISVVPAQTTVRPARSGCVWSMPVSTIPTVTPPLDGKPPMPPWSQPSGASMSASARPPDWPVLLRPQSSPKRASFGIADACRITLGSA